MSRQLHNQVNSGVFRQGFSLLELMIVLAVMVVLASISVPSLMEGLREGEVLRAAELVRETLSDARRIAIDSGIDYQFRYEVNGQYFVVLPTEVEPTAANSMTADESAGHFFRIVGQLDPAFRLVIGGDEAVDRSERLEVAWFGDLSDASTLAGKAWSQPVYFRFDGSATDGLLKVVDEERRTAEITVRGLTGSVRLAPVYTEALK